MSINLTFKSVSDIIRKQGKEDPQLIKAMDDLLGLVLICSPAVLSSAGDAILSLLSVKNELIKIGRNVFKKLTKDKPMDYLLREDTMRAAYSLLVFTSFFDALDHWLPDALRQELQLVESEKKALVMDAVRTVADWNNIPEPEKYELGLCSVPIAFPYPFENLQVLTLKHREIWKQLAQGFAKFIRRQSFYRQEIGENTTRFKIDDLEGNLLERPEINNFLKTVETHYAAQFFELAREYPDFAVWSQLYAHERLERSLSELSEDVRRYALLCSDAEQHVETGFRRLREAVFYLPEFQRTEQASEISDCLRKHYQARIEDKILESEDNSNESRQGLNFPSRQEAFIPQSFKLLRKENPSLRLEDEATWQDLPRLENLEGFMLSHLRSPYCTETPLVVVGHPGSGKTLLTIMLSAALMANRSTVIRVPLMDVDADGDIISQIDETIKRITGADESWLKLRTQFKDFPPLVILDGYDELLQASGQIFSGYIKDAKRFQQQQREQGWPVRVLITSRITLIDQASVPMGTTILRLLEFNERQRERWVSVWNKANACYFQESRTNLFELPNAADPHAAKILNLAEQPLLLLMLALYDSQGNQLRRKWSLDRTELYNSLLRRFVLRERCKQKGFSDEKQKEIDAVVNWEMQRLGVTALGMYNRRKTHIFATELDADLEFFQLERSMSSAKGKALSQAEMLIGSFFFIHKSRALFRSARDAEMQESTAFEFLHNTFSEFLAADYLLRSAIKQVKYLLKADLDEDLYSVRDTMLNTPDGMGTPWLAGLAYTPLFIRPAILEMIREWVPSLCKEASLTQDDFVAMLEKIVVIQINRLLHNREMPSIFWKSTCPEGRRIPYAQHSLLRHLSIFSINLILLRVVCGQTPFTINESHMALGGEDDRIWDRLLHLWRSEFSLESLNGLAAIMVAERGEKSVQLRAKESFQAEQIPKGSADKLLLVYNVALALGDTVTAKIAISHLTRLSGSPI